jgi:hypothetical protein
MAALELGFVEKIEVAPNLFDVKGQHHYASPELPASVVRGYWHCVPL